MYLGGARDCHTDFTGKDELSWGAGEGEINLAKKEDGLNRPLEEKAQIRESKAKGFRNASDKERKKKISCILESRNPH